MGRKILHGGRCLKLMRITRTRLARVEQRWMDEHLVLSGGHAVSFKQAMFDHNLKDLTFFTEKHIKYATREAIDVQNKRYSLFPSDGSLSASSASVHAATKRFIKERVYNHLPFWLGPLGYFLYRYFLRLGFLDGRAGLIYHFLQGFWYRFLVGAKVVEYDTVLATCADNTTRLAELERLTGHNLTESRARPQGAPTG